MHSGRTTHAHVSSAASRLTAHLGYKAYTIQTGSKTNGVSWALTFYKDDPRTSNPDYTIRLGFTATESFDMLVNMIRGIELYLMPKDRGN